MAVRYTGMLACSDLRDAEVNFSLIGTVFGVTSSCFVSLNSIYTKASSLCGKAIATHTLGRFAFDTQKVSPLVNDDKWVLQYYNNGVRV